MDIAVLVFVLAFGFVFAFALGFGFGLTVVLLFDFVAGIFCSLTIGHDILTVIVTSAFLVVVVIFFRPGFAIKRLPGEQDSAKLASASVSVKTLTICL